MRSSNKTIFGLLTVIILISISIAFMTTNQPSGEFIKPTKPAPIPEPEEPLLSQTPQQVDKTAYFYANGQKIVSMDAGGILYYITDHLGGTNKVYDADGNLVSEVEYYAYGQDKLETGEEQDYKYTGKEKDDSTGLYYYGARYYEPFAGRFTAIDRVKGDINDPQSLNGYAYVQNNPLMYVDPTGNEKKTMDFNQAFPDHIGAKAEKIWKQLGDWLKVEAYEDSVKNYQDSTEKAAMKEDNSKNKNVLFEVLGVKIFMISAESAERDDNQVSESESGYVEALTEKYGVDENMVKDFAEEGKLNEMIDYIELEDELGMERGTILNQWLDAHKKDSEKKDESGDE